MATKVNINANPSQYQSYRDRATVVNTGGGTKTNIAATPSAYSNYTTTSTKKSSDEPKSGNNGNSGIVSSGTTSSGRTLVDTSNKASKSSLASNYDPNVEDSSNDYWDEYLAYQAQVEAAQKAAIQAAVDQNVNTLNAQKDTTAQDYADAYRQLYINNMKSQKNIGQQMAAQGVTGGASESTLLGLNTNYEDNLRQGKVAEQNALSSLDQAIANAQLSGSIEAANAAATTGQNTANAYLTAWQQQLAADQAAKELAASQASENKGYAYQLAMSMMQAGSMPSDAVLSSAGISKADAQTIVANYVAAKTRTGSGSSSGNANGDTYSSVLSYAQQLANQKGKTTALAYLKDAYNSTVFDSISGSKSDAYNAMINSINGMF